MEFSDSDIGEFAFSHYSVKGHTAESTQSFLTLLQLTFYNLQFLLHKHSSSRSGENLQIKRKNYKKIYKIQKHYFFKRPARCFVLQHCVSVCFVLQHCVSVYFIVVQGLRRSA